MRYGRDEYADTATIENHHMAYIAGIITEPKSLSEALTTNYTKECKAANLEYNYRVDEAKLDASGCLKSNEEVMEMVNVSKDTW